MLDITESIVELGADARSARARRDVGDEGRSPQLRHHDPACAETPTGAWRTVSPTGVAISPNWAATFYCSPT